MDDVVEEDNLPPLVSCTRRQLRTFYDRARAGKVWRYPAWMEYLDTYWLNENAADLTAPLIGPIVFDLDKLDLWYISQLVRMPKRRTCTRV